jgi:[acyl-carrier-protein] S-malonyltransferase
MASMLAILRPSAPAPLAGRRARAAAPATARVALSSRSRYSSVRVSLGSEVAVGADALFADYKPTTAFLFPGQVR